MQRNRLAGLRMFLPLGLLLALGAAWSVWWLIASSTAQAQYAQAQARLAADGIALRCGEQSWGGYPFRIEMTCSSPVLAVQRDEGEIAISAERLMAVVQAYNPTHGLILLSSPTRIEGLAEPVTVTHEEARASLRLIDGDRLQASAEVPDLSAPGLGTARSILLHVRAGRSGQADLAGTATELALGAVKLDLIEFDAGLPVALLAADEPLRLAAQTGGTLDIRRAALRQDSLTASVTGALSLDTMGRLEGRLSTEVSDLDLLIERVGTALGLKPADIQAARSLLGLLKASGGRIDLVAKSGILYWGPLKITEIPPLFR